MKHNVILLFRKDNWILKTLKETLEAEGYYVMITEIMLPKMDGIQLLNILIDCGVSFPILITSFHVEAETGKAFEKQGAFRYIPYSRSPVELLDVVLEATAII